MKQLCKHLNKNNQSLTEEKIWPIKTFPLIAFINIIGFSRPTYDFNRSKFILNTRKD